jgi:AcrR family transcriptional regulator
MTEPATRDQIVQAADRLFYERGYDHTSFADIAGVVKISRGNFYYHFRTKDEILDAVISARLAGTRAMLDRWEIDGESPKDRIRSFINILIANRADIKRYGCPVGTLCTELAKLGHPAQAGANELFTLFRVWLRRQFTLLGRARDADALTMYLLARSQGVATLASAFRDETFIRQEVQDMHDWLEACAKFVGGPKRRAGAQRSRAAPASRKPRPSS